MEKIRTKVKMKRNPLWSSSSYGNFDYSKILSSVGFKSLYLGHRWDEVLIELAKIMDNKCGLELFLQHFQLQYY